MDRVNYLSNQMELKLIYTKYYVILKDAILFTLTALAAKLQLPQMEQINSDAFLLSECHSLIVALQSKSLTRNSIKCQKLRYLLNLIPHLRLVIP